MCLLFWFFLRKDVSIFFYYLFIYCISSVFTDPFDKYTQQNIEHYWSNKLTRTSMHFTLQQEPHIPNIPIRKITQPRTINPIAIFPTSGICLNKSPTTSRNSAPPFNSPPITARPRPVSWNKISGAYLKSRILTELIKSRR